LRDLPQILGIAAPWQSADEPSLVCKQKPDEPGRNTRLIRNRFGRKGLSIPFRQIIVPSNEESSLRAHPAALPGGEFFVE
jgi:hypothetical protein